VSTEEFDGGEPDEFARTDLRTGHPAPAWSWRTTRHGLWSRFGAYISPSRVVVAVIATLMLAALVATQLGYIQRLLDVARYRIQMVGVPELTETTIAPQPPTHLSMPNWEKISLPVPASQIHSFSADPSDPDSLLVCGFSLVETSPIHGEMTSRGPIAIWLSRDAGKTWTRSQAPAITGTYCQLDRAPDLPKKPTVTIERPAPIDPNCAQYDVLLSDDNGAYWHAIPAAYVAAFGVVTFCSHYAFMVLGRLYLYSSWDKTSSGKKVNDTNASLAHSDDGGRHWSEAGGADAMDYLNGRTTYLSDGTILTTGWPRQQVSSEDTSILWASTDKGDTWKPFSSLRGIVGQRILTSLGAQSTLAGVDRPLYLSYAEHIPSLTFHLKAAQITDDRHWAYLPPLPAPGTSRDHTGLTSILGATASGKLLSLGVYPQTGIQTDTPLDEQFDQQWLWSWDPHMQRWTSLAPPLPVAWKACSDGCWRASFAQSAASKQTVLWVRGFVAEDGSNDLYRLALPAEIT
jgi:hypothetical protein